MEVNNDPDYGFVLLQTLSPQALSKLNFSNKKHHRKKSYRSRRLRINSLLKGFPLEHHDKISRKCRTKAAFSNKIPLSRFSQVFWLCEGGRGEINTQSSSDIKIFRVRVFFLHGCLFSSFAIKCLFIIRRKKLTENYVFRDHGKTENNSTWLKLRETKRFPNESST